MGTIIESSRQYTVLETVEDAKSGNTYQRIQYKGIDEEGYIKDLPGVSGGETISKSWWRRIKKRNEPTEVTVYRHTVICQGEYDPESHGDPVVDYEIDIWFYTRSPVNEGAARRKLDSILNAALPEIREVLPFVECEERKYETNRPFTRDEYPPPRPFGAVQAKGNRYTMTIRGEEGQWNVTIDW